MTRIACAATLFLMFAAAAITLIMALYVGLYFHWAVGTVLFFLFCACTAVIMHTILGVKKAKVHINDLPYESHEAEETEEKHR